MSNSKKFEQCLNLLLLISRLDNEESESEQADQLRDILYDLWMDLPQDQKQTIHRVSAALS